MRTQTRKTSLYICRAAAVAALYVLLTLLSSLLGLSSGPIQFRLSEILCILPVYTSAAIPGLGMGCLIANIISGVPLWDILLGSAATLIGAVGSRLLCKWKYAALMPPIAANTVIIPLVIKYFYSVGVAYPFVLAGVALGEIICCGIGGMLLIPALDRIAPRVLE